MNRYLAGRHTHTRTRINRTKNDQPIEAINHIHTKWRYTQMEETISLKEIFEVIKKRFMMIVAFVLGAALIAAILSYFVMTPKYESSSQFIVNQGEQSQQQEQYNLNDVRLNVELINTYSVIIKSERILDQVVETLGLDYSAGALESKLNVSSEQNSQVVTV